MNIFVVTGYLLSFGIADCLWVYPNKKFPVVVSLTIRSTVTSALFLILFLFTNKLFSTADPADVINAIIISGVSYGGLYCYVKSLNYEKVAVIAPVTTILTSLLGLVFSIIFYHEIVTLKIACCLTGAFIGVALSFSKPGKTTGKLKITKGTLLSIGAAILWAVSYTFFKTPVDKLGVIRFSLILEVTILFINVIFLISGGYRKDLLLVKFDKPTITLFIIGSLIWVGTLLNSYSYKLFSLLSLNVLGKVGVVIPILYCVIFLKQKLSLVQIGGISLLVICAITIAL